MTTTRISLLMTDGPARGTRVLLPTSGPATIGRNPRCQIVIDHPLVSRQHCMVTAIPGTDGVEVVDLASNNGTKIDGEKITAATQLTIGKRFRVGPTEFEIQQFRPRTAASGGSGGSGADEDDPDRDDVLELLGISDDDDNDAPLADDWNETQTQSIDAQAPTLRIDLDRQKSMPLKVAGEIRNFAEENGFTEDSLIEIGIASAAIVENTLKHAGKGGLQARCDDQAFELEVWDSGPGVPDAVVESPPDGGGIERARHSMDTFTLSSSPGSTRVVMRKNR